jgi:hypothetical protein
MTDYGPHIDSFRHYRVDCGTVTADVAAFPLTDVPWEGKLDNVKVSAASKSGTSPTLTIMPKVGATGKLSAAVAVADGAWTAGTLATDPSVAAGADLIATLDIGGTDTPTFVGVVIEFDLIRT